MESICPACGNKRESSDSFCKHCGAAGSDLSPVHTVPTGRREETDASNTVEDQLREALAPGYQLIRKLGEGGMGSVFLARDPILKRMIAVKVLASALAHDPDSRKRFEREARSVAAVAHPNIVSIFSTGELKDDTPYFLMQYVAGKSLEDRIRDDGPLGMDEAKLIIGQVGAALAAAHRAGIIHRDIKPANVLQDEETGRVLVSDFGISAVRPGEDEGDNTKLTQAGMSIGTPAYMSPEQIAAEVVTDRTDIYSLGILAYEVLTGEGPYNISTPQEAIAAHLRDEPKKLSSLRDDIDIETQTLLEACLDKDPENRPDAREIERRLMRGSGGLLEWPPPGLDKLVGALRRAGWLLLLASGLVAVPVSFGVTTFSANSLFAPVIALLALVGFVAFSVFAFHSMKAVKNVSFELKRGFGLLTLLEVTSDPDGRTGDLIAGTREFAGVNPSKRNVLRLLRAMGAVMIFLSGFLPAATLFLLFWLGSRDLIGHDGIKLWVAGPTAFLLLVVLLLSSYEKSAVSDSRRRSESRSTPIDPGGRLVQSWTDTFEVARKGQNFSSGPTGNRTAIWAIGGSLVLLTLALGVALVMIVASNFIWVAYGGLAVNGIPGRGREEVEFTSFSRQFRIPADPDITTALASQALYSLEANYGDFREFENVPDADFLTWQAEWEELLESDLSPWFGRLRAPVNLITAAFDGTLTRDETDRYARIAGDPMLALFAIVARARNLDLWAAQFGSPISEEVMALRPESIPSLNNRTGYFPTRLRFLEAVGRIGGGDILGGEVLLKEIVSVGLLLRDEYNDSFGNFKGRGMVSYGLTALGVFYWNSGQTAKADSIREALADVRQLGRYLRAATTSGEIYRSGQSWRNMLVETVADSMSLRGSRWWAISELSMIPCLNLREFVFGPDEDIREAMTAARTQLVRSETEAQMFAKLTNPGQKLPEGIATSLISPFRWVLGKHTSSCLVF